MGLKLHHIDTTGAHGDLDGQPFRLEADASGWRAEIGKSGQAWTRNGVLAETGRLAISEIRVITYHVVSLYRSFQRFGSSAA